MPAQIDAMLDFFSDILDQTKIQYAIIVSGSSLSNRIRV